MSSPKDEIRFWSIHLISGMNEYDLLQLKLEKNNIGLKLGVLTHLACRKGKAVNGPEVAFMKSVIFLPP